MAKILIADDDATLRTFVCKVIEKIGHTPIEAGDGKEAFEKFQKESADLSIVDINMPEMDGIDYLEQVKSIDSNSVIIVMTGYPSAETIIETIEDDGYTYITKPIEVKTLEDLIKRGLESREARLKGEWD